jgi:hypothetical protein
MLTDRLTVPAPRGSSLILLLWVRWRLLRASLLQGLRSPLKAAVITVVWTVLLAGLYLLAHEGLRFLYETAGVGPFLLDRLWFLFLFVVTIMLAVSQVTSAYSTIIRASETHWWMTLPVTARTLSRVKWMESSVYSAWAVVLLVVPIVLAYLYVLQRPLWLAGWLAFLMIPLMATVTALATMALVLWLRWFGRIAIRREVMVVGFVAACSLLFWVLGEHHEESGQEAWFVALQELLPRMQVAMSPWLPSSWVATALGSGMNGRWLEGTLYAVLLWMTALVSWRLLDHVGALVLLPVLRTARHTPEAKPHRVGTSEVRITSWRMRDPFRASVTKDLLLVIRDPMQWGQAVVFFGLLGAYFANIHRLGQFSVEPSWRIGVASLNLACTLLVFGSLAVRFVYPQTSLEGRSLWLLRLAPAGVRHLLTAKLCVYSALGLLIIGGLLWLSMSRLQVPFPIRWWLAAVGVVAALTLVALAVGLGAWWIDPSVQDAARVVSSSNGALALVLMLAYVGCVVGALLLAWISWTQASALGVGLASVGLCAVSGLASWWPMHQGMRRLTQLEPFV